MTDRCRALLLLCALAACAAEEESADDAEMLPDPVVMGPEQLEEYARLAPVTEPVELSDGELGHVLELRRHYGLETDPGFVRALHDRPADHRVSRSTSMLFAGLLLEESEIPAALERAEVEYRGPEADLWAQRELGPRYAGSFLEGRKVILQCAGCDRAEVARAFADRRDMPEVLRGRIEVRAVEHSFADLQGMEERLAAAMRERGIDGNGVGLDVVENELDLIAGPSSIAVIERELAALEEAAGGPIELIESDIDREEHAWKHEALPYALVEGGQYIDNGVNACTSGFAVQGYYGPFMLTAAHCVNAIGETWYQGGAPLGRVAITEHGARMDVAAITTYGTRNNWGRIHIDAYNDRATVAFPVTDHYLGNATVCNSGARSTCLHGLCGLATRCGVVEYQVFRPYSWNDPVWGCAGYYSMKGDSGAGVYWPTGYGNGAVGIANSLNGEREGGRYCAIYSRMPIIMAAWGLSLSPW